MTATVTFQTANPTPPAVLVDDEDHVVATWNLILVVIWRGEMRAPAVSELHRLAADFTTASPSGPVGRVVIVEKEANLPSADARRKVAELSGRWPFAFTAYVFEGGGFQAASVRGIVTGLVLEGRPSFPVQLHSSVAEAARWIESIAPSYGPASELEVAVEGLRQRRIEG